MSDLLPPTAALGRASPRFEIVPFHDAQILAARSGGEVRVPMKRFCETIGLPWEPQRKRIMRDDVLAEGASIMEVPSEGGLQEQITLPLDLIPGFLFGAVATRYAPELQARVRMFRSECFRVLSEHFFGRRQVVDLTPADAAALTHESVRLMTLLRRESSPQIRRTYHAMLDRLCIAQEVPTPALDAIGADAIAPEQLVEPFMRGLETLSVMGIVWNHARIPGQIAFVLAEVLDHFERYQIPMPAHAHIARALRLHGPVVDATVPMLSNLTNEHVLCWVFKDQADG